MSPISEQVRQTGRTFRQLQALPIGGCFVVHHHRFIPYCRNLMPDRKDIKYLTLSHFDDTHSWRGIQAPCVAVDHHAQECMTARQWDHYNLFRLYLEVHNGR